MSLNGNYPEAWFNMGILYLDAPSWPGLDVQGKLGMAISNLTRYRDMMASRLALDVRRLTFTFDPDSPSDRERIGRLYRHAHVIVHEARDGRVAIVADVPRRLVSRMTPAADVDS